MSLKFRECACLTHDWGQEGDGSSGTKGEKKHVGRIPLLLLLLLKEKTLFSFVGPGDAWVETRLLDFKTAIAHTNSRAQVKGISAGRGRENFRASGRRGVLVECQICNHQNKTFQ